MNPTWFVHAPVRAGRRGGRGRLRACGRAPPRAENPALQGRRLGAGQFDAIAEASELADHSGRPVSLRLLAEGWASFLVPDALVQDQPDQAAQPVGDQADRLLVPEPGHVAAIEELEEGAFGFRRGIGRLVEQAPHLPVALRGAVPVAHLRALVLAGAG